MKILVIDDSKTNRELAQAQLASEELTVVGSYEEGEELLKKPHDFDVVLTDLLMPPCTRQQKSRDWAEMPVGIFLGLLAAKNGAKFVAVFTDSDHHSHPASECFDAFNPKGEIMPDLFQVGDAKVTLCNSRQAVGHFDQSDLAKELSWKEAEEVPSVRGKNWRAVFEYVLGKRTRAWNR